MAVSTVVTLVAREISVAEQESKDPSGNSQPLVQLLHVGSDRHDVKVACARVRPVGADALRLAKPSKDKVVAAEVAVREGRDKVLPAEVGLDDVLADRVVEVAESEGRPEKNNEVAGALVVLLAVLEVGNSVDTELKAESQSIRILLATDNSDKHWPSLPSAR